MQEVSKQACAGQSLLIFAAFLLLYSGCQNEVESIIAAPPNEYVVRGFYEVVHESGATTPLLEEMEITEGMGLQIQFGIEFSKKLPVTFDCLRDGKPEISWQPYFERARFVLDRSLLK